MTDTAKQIKEILAETDPDIRTDSESIIGPLIDEVGGALDHINAFVAMTIPLAASEATLNEALDLLEEWFLRGGDNKIGDFLRRVAPERADRVEANWTTGH